MNSLYSVFYSIGFRSRKLSLMALIITLCFYFVTMWVELRNYQKKNTCGLSCVTGPSYNNSIFDYGVAELGPQAVRR